MGLHLQQNRFKAHLAALGAALLCGVSAPLLAEELPPLEGRTNLAAGAAVQFAPNPNYSITARNGQDASDLTDGQLTKREDREIWREPEAVGWSYGGRVNLALDLGKPCEINEIAIRLLGGSPQPGISIPLWVEAFVSDDGERYTKVAEFSRWNQGDLKKFGVPEDKGKAWVHALRFENLKARGRWVGLRMYTNGVAVSDELYVFGQPVAGAEAGSTPSPAADSFSVTQPQPYFHKPELILTTNLAAPLPIGLVTPDGKPATGKVELALDVPPGVLLRAGSIGKVPLETIAPEKLPDGGQRYRFSVDKPNADKVFGRLYVQASGWRDGQTGALRYRFAHDDWQSAGQSIPLRAVTVPQGPRLKKIMAGMGWWSPADTILWPDALQAWRTLGFNDFPLFGMWMPKDSADPQWQLVEKARGDGFTITNIDSPLHKMQTNHKNEPEIYCQLETGPGKFLCPSYRGPFYDEEIQRFSSMMARVKPDYSSQDIELWGWRGPVDSRNCSRCQADFKASGLASWEEWQLVQGDEMWSDLINGARTELKKVGADPNFVTGGYDFRPGHAYQNVFGFDRLYPQVMDVGQVSTYTNFSPYGLELTGDATRDDRAKLPRSDVMPWLSPGDSGVFPGEAFQWALLESYCNGARGIYFWSSRVWDAESLVAYARVLRAIAPVEDVIVQGELLGDAVQVEGAGRLSGMRNQREMVLLAADYSGQTSGIIKLRLDVPERVQIRDLFTGKVLHENLPRGAQTIAVPLDGAPARLLHVSPAR
jgi:hypothetical protein